MAQYVGGPCNGLPLDDSFTEPRVCGGVTYTRGADGNYHVNTGGGGAVGVAALGPHAPQGWRDLQASVNRRLPTSLMRSRKFRRAAQRSLGRKRRLR